MKDNELPRESGQNEKSAKKRIVKNTTILGQWQVTWDKDFKYIQLSRKWQKSNFSKMVWV